MIYFSILCLLKGKDYLRAKIKPKKLMPTLASLILNGHSYDVKVQNHNFDVPIGWSGFPRQSLLGDGQLHILMDTPADNFILELMFKTKEKSCCRGLS